MDTRKKETPKRIKGRAAAVFFLALLLLLGLSHTQVKRQVEEQKLRATYTAENTVRRIESQLNRYLEKSDLLKRMIEGDYPLSDGDFAVMASLLMDIQMPKMDGYQATRAIRALGDAHANICVISMTANAFDEDKKRAMEAGMDDYITKPIRAEKLMETLRTSLG